MSAATAAPNANAVSFSQLTGIPITSAASGSSRSERQARPVREWLTKRSATNTTSEERERDVEVRDGEDPGVLHGEVVPEEAERVDAAGSRSARP